MAGRLGLAAVQVGFARATTVDNLKDCRRKLIDERSNPDQRRMLTHTWEARESRSSLSYLLVFLTLFDLPSTS